MIKLRILRWGDCPELSRWTQYNHKGPLDGNRRTRVRGRDVMKETEVRVLWDHEPRNVGSL